MRIYHTPVLEQYGTLANVTGLFKKASTSDVLVNEQGQVVLSLPGMSIDACAEVGDKCVCADNGTC